VPQVRDAVLDRSADRVDLVMQLVHGTSLRACIDPRRPLPVTWAATVAAQICAVLSHAHAVHVGAQRPRHGDSRRFPKR
jgi:serine/threonine protein kinase